MITATCHRLYYSTHRLFPGFLVSALVALAAQSLAQHYGSPAMLNALLLGLALNFLGEDGIKTADGVAFTARTVLRVGVALLGARISIEVIAGLGMSMILLTVSGVVATIGLAMLVARAAGRDWRFALLTGGSVAICGASAAVAIAAILPRHDKSDRDLTFTVLSVTLLSTVAMVLYPLLVSLLNLDTREAGVFIGGTIHDVAQVVGAGFSINAETGESATVVKLIRVSMLAPVLLCASLVIRQAVGSDKGDRPPLLPGFVVAFILIAAANSAGLIPGLLAELAADLSGWALLTAIAAVGIKTSIGKLLNIGGGAIGVVVVETIFIAGWVMAGILLLI